MATKPLVEVALRFTGQGFAPEDVTRLVGLTPTKTWRLGDAIQQTQLRRKCDGWVIGLPSREAYDMDNVLRELLDILAPHEDRIAEAARQFALAVEISVGVYISGETPASLFSADTIRRLSSLQASLDIDLILIE